MFSQQFFGMIAFVVIAIVGLMVMGFASAMKKDPEEKELGFPLYDEIPFFDEDAEGLPDDSGDPRDLEGPDEDYGPDDIGLVPPGVGLTVAETKRTKRGSR